MFFFFSYQIDVLHAGDILAPELTILDVVYMYKYTEEGPLKFSYTVTSPVTVRSKRKYKQSFSFAQKVQSPKKSIETFKESVKTMECKTEEFVSSPKIVPRITLKIEKSKDIKDHKSGRRKSDDLSRCEKKVIRASIVNGPHSYPSYLAPLKKKIKLEEKPSIQNSSLKYEFQTNGKNNNVNKSINIDTKSHTVAEIHALIKKEISDENKNNNNRSKSDEETDANNSLNSSADDGDGPMVIDESRLSDDENSDSIFNANVSRSSVHVSDNVADTKALDKISINPSMGTSQSSNEILNENKENLINSINNVKPIPIISQSNGISRQNNVADCNVQDRNMQSHEENKSNSPKKTFLVVQPTKPIDSVTKRVSSASVSTLSSLLSNAPKVQSSGETKLCNFRSGSAEIGTSTIDSSALALSNIIGNDILKTSSTTGRMNGSNNLTSPITSFTSIADKMAANNKRCDSALPPNIASFVARVPNMTVTSLPMSIASTNSTDSASAVSFPVVQNSVTTPVNANTVPYQRQLLMQSMSASQATNGSHSVSPNTSISQESKTKISSLDNTPAANNPTSSNLGRPGLPTFPFGQRPPFIAPTKPRLGRPPNPNKVQKPPSRGRGGGRGSRGGGVRRVESANLPGTARPNLPHDVASMQLLHQQVQAMQQQHAQVAKQQQVQHVYQQQAAAAIKQQQQLQQQLMQAVPNHATQILPNIQQQLLQNPHALASFASNPQEFAKYMSFLQLQSQLQKQTVPSSSMNLSPSSNGSGSQLNFLQDGNSGADPLSPNSFTKLQSSSPTLSSPLSKLLSLNSAQMAFEKVKNMSADGNFAAVAPQTAMTQSGAPSPKPAKSPAPASPSTPSSICSQTPEVTITKLPPVSNISTNNKTSSTNTVSITKRSHGISITAATPVNDSKPGNTISNSSVRQIPNPSFLSNSKKPNSPVSISKYSKNIKSNHNNGTTKSPQGSTKHSFNFNNNINNSKESVPNMTHTAVINQVFLPNSIASLTGMSNLLQMENMTKSLPPSTVANGIQANAPAKC